MPARKIKKNYLSVTGTFYSLKNKKHIANESILERDLFLSLEFDKNVLSYEEQPFTTYYYRNNVKYRYTPDCLVFYKDNRLPCVIEVKYSSELKEKKIFLKEKFEQIEKYLTKNDMDFKLFTEIDIEPIYLENIRFLYRFANIKNERYLDITLTLLKNFKGKTIYDLLNSYSNDIYKQAEIQPYIWNAIIKNRIELDLKNKITKDSIIKVTL